jgi:flagellar motor switch protein FliN/FliY
MADRTPPETAAEDFKPGEQAPAAANAGKQQAAAADFAPAVEEPQLEQLQEEKPIGKKGENMSVDFLLDVPLTITVEVGRTKMLINDFLQLGQGSVIELNKLIGQPLEILVNEKLIARGDVVVVNEKYGIRLTDIVSPTERVESLASSD